jgi:hypothetical protein
MWNGRRESNSRSQLAFTVKTQNPIKQPVLGPGTDLPRNNQLFRARFSGVTVKPGRQDLASFLPGASQVQVKERLWRAMEMP